MIIAAVRQDGPSLMSIEAGLTAIAIAVSFSCPRLGASFFTRVEHAFGRLARRKSLSVFVVGASAFLLRLAILPLCPAPLPFAPGDFSFLLAADTFASGRLTNPTPAMWVHFESIHITMIPTYMSMYFPAQGLLLAAGKLLTGHPWFGILAATALMSAALCWMLQAWLPTSWALLGGLLSVLRLGLFSYWINTYSGAGSISALGGALVLGALPRLMRNGNFKYAVTMAIGISFLLLTRPYEGLLLCLPVLFILGKWALVGKNKLAPSILFRRAALPLLLVFAAGAWMGYYDYRAFGNPLTPPYKVDRATYAMAPYYVWQSARPEPHYRHAILRNFYYENELVSFRQIHSRWGFLPQTMIKGVRAVLFFAGFALIPPLIMLPRVFADRRIRFLTICLSVSATGMIIEVFFLPHYVAPLTALFYALALQAMRHLRLWRVGDQPVGSTMLRLCVTLCVILAAVRLLAEPLHITTPEFPASAWSGNWYGPGPFGWQRARLETRLEHLPGKQLVIVRYDLSNHNPINEWVYNAPDIDQSKVIWAREMEPAENLDLIKYYKGRNVWLVQPDSNPLQLSPYPVQEQESASLK